MHPPSTARQILDAIVNIVHLKIERDCTRSLSQPRPLWNSIDGDDTFGAKQEGAFDGKLADRSAPPRRNRLPPFNPQP
jgi:hypothetical protein